MSNRLRRVGREGGSLLLGFVIVTATAAAGRLPAAEIPPADVALCGGRIVTLDPQESIAEALAVRQGRIVAVGKQALVNRHIGPSTRVVALEGRMVLPGFIETHCHPVGIALAELEQPYAELTSIAQLQQWLRQRAKEVPPGEWIRVPRNEITRLSEQRFPTVAELDAACSTHPVVYTSVRKHVLNSLAFERLGITAQTDRTPGGGRLLRDAQGRPWMISGGDSYLQEQMPRPAYTEDETTAALVKLLKHYNSVGITSIFDRANTAEAYLRYRRLHEGGQLPLRVTVTFRNNALRSAAAVERFAGQLGIRPGEGNDWVKPGPLKITVDGGIHWGNTRLTEPYGTRRIAFYHLDDPQYQGDLNFSPDEMREVFAAAHRLGWQMSCHVTGDGGVERVLDALEASTALASAADRRFTLIHAYFPSPAIVERCRRLGVCVDTQAYLYYRDADAIHKIYGPSWSERFIGLGDWVRGGVPVAVNSDHMIGLDADHAMNSFNPFLMLWIAVARKDDRGNVYGPGQRLSRSDALRAVTLWAAHLSFDEDKLGSLEAGKLADLVVIDRDYLNCPVDEIRQTRPVMTMVGGRIVFQHAD